MVKAWTMNVRMTSASRMAMAMASTYSRRTDLRRRGTSMGGTLGCPLTAAGSVLGGLAESRRRGSSAISALEDRQERFLRDLDLPDLLHALLAFLLALQQLALARDVAAVALGGDVLAHGLDGLAGDDPAADGGLDGHLVELARDDAPQLLHQRLAPLVGLVAVDDDAERVHRIAVEQDVELHEVGGPEVGELVVERGVAPGDRLQLVVEVDHDLRQREVEADVH